MMYETSCGAVVYTIENGSIKYIIIKSKDGIYGLPKGHLEANETTYECALREICEETSLSVDLINGFCVEDEYVFQREEATVSKRVIYYLAQYYNQNFSPDNKEVLQIFSIDYATALSL
ncbi:MAG: NUDIX domain-containing protein [Clostridia bacterium]|nr:NUDIX domain-containing protein [Clostridia bacterium]